MAIPISQENLKKVTDMMNDKTVDYSRIDWNKCKLKPLPCLMADGETQQLTVQAVWDASHGNAVITVSGYHTMAKTGSGSIGWKFLHCNVASTADQALELIERAKEVNSFITTETARIETEDEVANFVKIPWQDAVWLQNSEVSLRVFLFPGSKEPKQVTWMLVDGKLHEVLFEGDKRTFPRGYDPEKPRWVKITWDNVSRLADAGCVIGESHDSSYGYRVRTRDHSAIKDWCYAIDIHTLPPGVPLHEAPKPVPRPCSKEFATKHPDESEWRFRDLSTEWAPISAWIWSPSDIYEFRTTAKAEVKSRVAAEVAVSSMVSGFYSGSNSGNVLLSAIMGPLSNGLKQAVVFEVTADCKEFKNPRIALIVDEDS